VNGDSIRRAANRLPDRTLELTARAARAASPGLWRDIRRWRTFIAATEQWSAERLAAYQVTKLAEVIAHAGAHVPY